MYITLPELAELPGARELAQVASTEHQPIVDDALMEATLRGTDRSEWSPEEIAEADAAAARIQDAVDHAGGVIDGFLGRRYTLPLASWPKILGTWCRAIARYQLHKDRISDERTDAIARDYRDALRLLQLVGEGKFSIGLGDPSVAAGDVRFDAGRSVWRGGMWP